MTTSSTLKSLSQAFANPGPAGYQTGIRAFDRFSLNIGPGKLILIGSRPTAGRTLFLLHLFFQIWKTEGVAQCFVTNEESSAEAYTRLAAIASGMERLKLRAEFDPAQPGCPDILQSDRDYFLERRTAWEVLKEELAQLVTEKGIRIVYIDKIQGLYSTEKFHNRDQEVGFLTREIRYFAIEHKVAVIISSSLSRRVDYREGKVPFLSDLRDSGAMEEHCDAALLIHRPIIYGITDDANGNSLADVAEVYMAKNRYGPTGTMLFRFNAAIPRFEEYVPPPRFDFSAHFEKSTAKPDVNDIAPF